MRRANDVFNRICSTRCLNMIFLSGDAVSSNEFVRCCGVEDPPMHDPPKERLVTIGIIPICYWHIHLNMVYLFKCMVANSDSNINIKKHVQETRTSTQGVLLDVLKCKTAAFQNSYYIRAANVWNTLPCCIRDTNKTLVSFKVSLKQHYKDLTSLVYNPGASCSKLV